jgi:hypothetical protein
MPRAFDKGTRFAVKGENEQPDFFNNMHVDIARGSSQSCWSGHNPCCCVDLSPPPLLFLLLLAGGGRKRPGRTELSLRILKAETKNNCTSMGAL